MGNTDYTPHMTCTNGHRYPYITGLSTNSFTFNAADDASDNNDGLFSWSVRGYITEE